MESIALLSSVGPPFGVTALQAHDARDHRLATQAHQPQRSRGSDTSASMAPVTIPAQTLSLGNTPTDFTNLPLAPALNLFDPSLGTLVSATVSHSATLRNLTTSQNLSTTSPTVITATLSGSYQINGLNQPLAQSTQSTASQPKAAGTFGSASDTVTFPPIQLSDSATTTFTDAASLAFFTASPGRTTITPTMTATATASATAPNGNLFTITQTSASATVTISYTYMANCPTAGSVGRIGVHHQRTLLILPFDGAVSPTLAGTTSDYSVITRAGKRIPIISADYNPATNSVTLRPAHRLNVHLHYRLSAELPCPDGQSGGTAIIPFGSKYSLLGFHDHRGRFVPVRDGKIVNFPERSRNDHRPGPIERTPAFGRGPSFPNRVPVRPDAGHAPIRARARAQNPPFSHKSG